MAKAPTTHRTPTEAAADARVQRLTSDPDLTQPTAVPADHGDTPPALSKPGGPADPTPAMHPDASAETIPRDGGRAGAGRPNLPDIRADPDLGKAMVALAEIAEHSRWGATYQTHVERVRWLHGWAARATAKLADREHIPPALWQELAMKARGWTNGGGS